MSAFFNKKTEETKNKVAPKVSDAPALAPEQATVVAGRSLIKRVYISEKAAKAKGFNQYVFEVATYAVRPEIKKEIQKKYNVNVIKINVLNMPAKKITVGRHNGERAGFRKAIVTLKEGQSIGE